MTISMGNNVLVVLHLSGGNDGLNTVIPYTDGRYYDNRPTLSLSPEEVLPISSDLALHPALAELKPFYDTGNMAIIAGIGHARPNLSHFRSMDIWHTAVPETAVPDGWLAKVVREIDPTGDNVLTAVNFGSSLPRALSMSGVPVASVTDITTYGLFTELPERQRGALMEVFSSIYGGECTEEPADHGHAAPVGQTVADVLRFIDQTGHAARLGADAVRAAYAAFQPSVVYPRTGIAESLRGVAAVKCAGLGTRVFYTSHGSFDTHALQIETHATRWQEVSEAVATFFADLRAHDAADDVLLFIWSEFGRRVRDNGGGTDHGAASVAFAIGERVQGGIYGEYPSLRADALRDGNLHYSVDFRLSYSTLLERWLQVESTPILSGRFEQLDFV